MSGDALTHEPDRKRPAESLHDPLGGEPSSVRTTAEIKAARVKMSQGEEECHKGRLRGGRGALVVGRANGEFILKGTARFR